MTGNHCVRTKGHYRGIMEHYNNAGDYWDRTICVGTIGHCLWAVGHCFWIVEH